MCTMPDVAPYGKDKKQNPFCGERKHFYPERLARVKYSIIIHHKIMPSHVYGVYAP